MNLYKPEKEYCFLWHDRKYCVDLIMNKEENKSRITRWIDEENYGKEIYLHLRGKVNLTWAKYKEIDLAPHRVL